MKHARWMAGLLGLTGVALGAFGAHVLKPTLIARGMSDVWETARTYHLLHAVAVLAVSTACSAPRPWLVRAAACWSIGVIFFSGSLYALALGGPPWLGPVTPLGGVTLLLGWCFVVIDGLCFVCPEKK